MLFFEISELELMVAGRRRGLSRGGRFQVLSAPVLYEIQKVCCIEYSDLLDVVVAAVSGASNCAP